jgi:thymidylate synthase (FAD)
MKTIKVLDHGFVTLRNISGPTRRADEEYDADDVDPANAARMSFGKTDSGRTREEDLRLCEYLIKNHHSTPLESIEIWIELKLPIFIARQFVR